MGDKAYSSAANRNYLRRRGIQAVIPVKDDRRGTAAPAAAAAAARPRSTRSATKSATRRALLFQAQAVRAVATRYDKRQLIYQGTVDVASIRIWLRDPPHDLHNTA